MSEIIHTSRKFRVWAYTVSHKRLLLRSLGEKPGDKRIDVFFGGVDRLLLKPDYHSLSVVEADATLQERYQKYYGPIGASLTLYAIEPDLRSFVVAGVAQVHEDDGDYRDPSYFGHFLGA